MRQFGWLVQVERDNRRVITRRFFVSLELALDWLNEQADRHGSNLNCLALDKVQMPARVRHLTKEVPDAL